MTDTVGLADAVRVAGIGAWDWHVRSGRLMLDESAMALLGIDPDTYDGQIDTWVGLLHPDDYSWEVAETRRALRTVGLFDDEYRVCRLDGATQWIHVRGRVLTDGQGSPCRMVGAAWATTQSQDDRDTRRAEQAAAHRPVVDLGAAERAARIQHLASALAEAVTSVDVVAAVAERVLPPFRASGLIMQVVEAGWMRVIGSVGYPQSFRQTQRASKGSCAHRGSTAHPSALVRLLRG
jgi:PAS domain-containing protein